MSKKNENKINQKLLFFIIFQLIFYLTLIFLIISINLNAKFIYKLDNFAFYLISFIRSPLINNVMLFITFFGETVVYVLFFLLLILSFFKKRKIFYPLIFTTSLSGIITFVLKNLVQRARPVGEFVSNLIIKYNFPSSFSFPSGHTQTSLVFYFLLTYTLLENFYNGKHKKIYLISSSIFSGLIMLSRLILGVHYFTDVLGGIIIALIIILNFLYFKAKQSY